MRLIKPSIGRGCVLFLMLLVLLYSLLIPPGLAAESEPVDLGVVELKGTTSGGTFTLTPSVMDDLFDLDAIYPGGSWKRTIHVTNETKRPMDVTVISCTPKTETSNALLDVLSVEVMAGGTVLYAGDYVAGSEDAPMIDALPIDGHGSLDLEIILHLDSDAGNALQGASLASVWQFGATYQHPPNKETTYTVYYVDKNGHELHAPKVVSTTIGASVTEQAIEIDGYIPDAAEKHILAKKSSSENRITFIYSPKGTSSASPPDTPEGVRTGMELEDDRNTMMYFLVFSLVLCTVLAIRITGKLTLLRKTKNTHDNREEDTQNGS